MKRINVCVLALSLILLSGSTLSMSVGEMAFTLQAKLLSLPYIQSMAVFNSWRGQSQEEWSSYKQEDLAKKAALLHALHWAQDPMSIKNTNFHEGQRIASLVEELAGEFIVSYKSYRDSFLAGEKPVISIPKHEVLQEMGENNIPNTQENFETWELKVAMNRLSYFERTAELATVISENSFETVEEKSK